MSLLLAGKKLKQMYGWLCHAQLATTLNVYIHDVDDGRCGAETWEEILPVGATVGPPHVRAMFGQGYFGEAATTIPLARISPTDRTRNAEASLSRRSF